MGRFIIPIVLLNVIALGQPIRAAGVERSEVTEKTLRFGKAGGDRLVIVDNVFGSIDVKGYDGEEVNVKIRKTIVARSADKANEAEEEVTLEVYEEDDVVELYVDGPFRDRRRRHIDWRGFDHEGYKVVFDFELEVPNDCGVELKTVNEGDISVSSIGGDFDVGNVNGGIEMSGLRGSGEVHAVNGPVKVEFDGNPRGDCSFGTINGDVRLYFQPGLSADFYLKSMNGEAFTDFEVEPLPMKTKATDSENGKKVYRMMHLTGIRAGNGGPEIVLNTLNGDMYILSR
jgi:uncharacterized protein (UPF0335 family)